MPHRRCPVLVALAVTLAAPAWAQPPTGRDGNATELVVVDVATRSSRLAHREPRRIAAPSWAPDGRSWVVNGGGSLWRIPADGTGHLEAIPITGTGGIDVDHGMSPDGATIGFTGGDQLSVAPSTGGAAVRLVETPGTYFHAWSSDGKSILVVTRRSENDDLFAIDRVSGLERRLTTNPAFDDTAAPSSDGRWIYFASNRSGRTKIWRLPAQGTDADAEQVTFDDRDDNSPHPSPDGKWLIYQSSRPGPTDHYLDHDMTIRLLALPAVEVKLDAPTSRAATTEVARFVGGHKALGANPWSPDSRQFVYAATAVPPPRAFIVFFTPPGLAEPPGVTARLTDVATIAERFLLDGMTQYGYPAAVSRLFARTPTNEVEIIRVEGTYPLGDPHYHDPAIRAEAIRLAQARAGVAGVGNLWWVFTYLGPPPTRFETWMGASFMEPEAFAIVNYNSAPGMMPSNGNLTEGFKAEPEFALKGAIHELGHALGLLHMGPDLTLNRGNTLMGANTSVYEQRHLPHADQVDLSEAAAALLWKNPILSGTAADRFQTPDDIQLTRFDATFDPTADRLSFQCQVAARPLPHSAILQDDVGRPDDGYWHPAYVGRVAADGTFSITINHPPRVKGSYQIFFAFPNGINTGGRPTTISPRGPIMRSYSFGK